jgi:hypothetical protein
MLKVFQCLSKHTWVNVFEGGFRSPYTNQAVKGEEVTRQNRGVGYYPIGSGPVVEEKRRYEIY